MRRSRLSGQSQACLVLIGLLDIRAAGSIAAEIRDDVGPPAAAQSSARENESQLSEEQQRALEQRACGPKVRHKASTDKSNRVRLEMLPGKALLYVVRPTMWGQKIQTKLAIDGHWVGINRGNTYFAVHVDPGEHALCAAAENRSVMTMTFEAGRTYYLQQQIRTGWNKARTRLVPLTESEGLAALDKTHVSTFAEK